jgi:hypothetical protein
LHVADENVVTYKIQTNADEKIFAFARKNGDDVVVVILNLSNEKIFCEILDEILDGQFINVFDKAIINLSAEKNVLLGAWEYVVYEKKKAPW